MSMMFIARYSGNYWNFDRMRDLETVAVASGTLKDEYPEAYVAHRKALSLFYPNFDPAEYPGEPPVEPAGIPFIYADTFYQARMAPAGGGNPELVLTENPTIESIKKKKQFYLERGYGWIAIVADKHIKKMIDFLDFPDGPLCLMYDIEMIPLNNDAAMESEHSEVAISMSEEALEHVYAHMTPAHWNAQ